MRKSLSERLWPRVVKAGPDECWLCSHTPGAKYGFLSRDGRGVGCHVVSYELKFGLVPDGLCVLHKCDTPRCVNPAHLYVGTYAQNSADALARGRHTVQVYAEEIRERGRALGKANTWSKGDVRPQWAKIPYDQIPLIRSDLAAGVSCATLARRYGVVPLSIKRCLERDEVRQTKERKPK